MPHAEYNDNYSTLETVPAVQKPAIDATSGLQVPIHDGLEIDSQGGFTEDAHTIFNSTEKGLPAAGAGNRHRFYSLHHKRFWVAIIFITLAIVALAVGLGVGLNKRKSWTSGSSPTPTTITTSIPTPVNNTSAASTPPTAVPILTNSKLASIAWVDERNVLQYRIYYQDQNNMIKESSWNADDNRWRVSNKAIGKARPGSPIAAAVTGPQQWNFQINIFAMNDDGIINEWYSGDGSSWQPGQINTHKVRPSSASSLSAIWHRYEKCVNCPNTLLLVYQDSKSKFNLANSTQNGLIFSTMDANPIAGSGISLALSWKDDTTTGLRFYYQIASGHLCSQDWFDPPADSRAARNGNWQNRESDPIQVISMNAQIASFTYGPATTSLPILLDILSSGSQGVTANWWTGLNGGQWLGPQSPSVMGDVDDYTALAAHKNAHVYAIQNGTVVEFSVESDGVTWTRLGEVVTT